MTTPFATSPALYTVRDSVDVLLVVPLPRGDVRVYSDVRTRAMEQAREHLVEGCGPGNELLEPIFRGKISISDRPNFGGPATSPGDQLTPPQRLFPVRGATRGPLPRRPLT